MLLLDTHIWLWINEGDRHLGQASVRIIEKAGFGNLCVSAISVWEIAMLVKQDRLRLDRNIHAWVETSIHRLGIGIIPIDADIALESCHLPEGFHKDPADRMIVATARCKGLKLMTQDKAILTYAKKGHVMAVK